MARYCRHLSVFDGMCTLVDVDDASYDEVDDDDGLTT